MRPSHAMHSLLRSRPAASACTLSSLVSRAKSTTSSSLPPRSSAASARPPPPAPKVEPTTFSGRSSPRNVHPRPEAIRGLPPSGTKPPWAAASIPTAPTGTATATGGGAGPTVNAMAFDGPSRPRMLYERVGTRELPNLRIRYWYYLALAALGLGAWGGFLLWATNAERIASSVFKSLCFQLRTSPDVTALLGRNVRPVENWYTFGDPWISGSVNVMQGRVDLSFRVKGSDAAGTVYFTSLRPTKEEGWRIVRYKVIRDDGEVLRLEDKVDKVQ